MYSVVRKMAQYMSDILEPEDREKLHENLLVGASKLPMEVSHFYSISYLHSILVFVIVYDISYILCLHVHTVVLLVIHLSVPVGSGQIPPTPTFAQPGR